MVKMNYGQMWLIKCALISDNIAPQTSQEHILNLRWVRSPKSSSLRKVPIVQVPTTCQDIIQEMAEEESRGNHDSHMEGMLKSLEYHG